MENRSTTESPNHYAGHITEESSLTLLHRLHTNERQLRTLAVILSLTGGLALSFALGVGIMIYWYSRKCKQKRRLSIKNPKNYNREDNDEDDDYDDDDEKSFYSNCTACDLLKQQQQQSQQQEEQDNVPNSVSHHELASSSAGQNIEQPEVIQQQQDEIMLLPPPPLALMFPTPEPSAPSAKELSHAHPNLASSSTSHPEEEGLCHDCLVPPPAYTENQS